MILNSYVNDECSIVLDWSAYDKTDKYFVIYRKQQGSDNWETIVDLNQHFCDNLYIDKEQLDVNSPSRPNVTINPIIKNNDISLNFTSNDNGNKYFYYIEAYDSTNFNLLSVSN